MPGIDAADKAEAAVSAEAVAAYLAAHPDFFLRHPALLDALQIPPRQSAAGVVDMQAAMVKRLRGDIDKLRTLQQELISAGRANRFGHPVPEVLTRYREAGAEVFRTDRDGAVTIDTDGYLLDVRTYTGRRFSR